MVTQYTKAPAPATAYTKSGGQIGGVGNPCAGVESDPAILVPSTPLTWTNVLTTTVSVGKQYCSGLTFGTRIAWFRGRPADDRGVVVHSTDGTTWAEAVPVAIDSFNNAGTFPKLALRTSDILSIAIGGAYVAGIQARVYETTDMAVFVQRHGNIPRTGKPQIVTLDGTLYVLIYEADGTTQLRLYKDSGAAWVEQAAYPVLGTPDEQAVEVAFGDLFTAVGATMRRWDPDSNAWSTAFTHSQNILRAAYWAERQELYISDVQYRIWRWKEGGTLTEVFIGYSGSPAQALGQIALVGRNLYWVINGTYNGQGGIHFFRSPDGVLIQYAGSALIADIANESTRFMYDTNTTRFYVASFGLDNNARIWQSSVPA